MNVTEIMGILPHRYPFLMVDRIVEMDVEAGTVVGIKNLTMNEEFFQGHFPGNPVMPGVLQMEAMAQVAGVMLNSREGNEGKVAYFMSMNKVKFRKMVVPGDQLRIEIEPIRVRSRMATVQGKAYVDGDLVSEAELSFGYGA
jgi:beta-hydroxyacyl-ACP dehydratase FabZ